MKINIEKAAATTGLSVKTLYKYIAARKIGYYKIGNLVRFDEQELNDWLEGKRVKPIA